MAGADFRVMLTAGLFAALSVQTGQGAVERSTRNKDICRSAVATRIEWIDKECESVGLLLELRKPKNRQLARRRRRMSGQR